MRHLKLLIAIIAIIATVVPVSAQLRFGLKGGIGVNSLKATELEYAKENATGYSVGVMVDFTVPVIGIGVDASLMYARRTSPVNVSFIAGENDVMVDARMIDKNYLEIPVNLKYALNLPAVGRIVKPYIATGPSVAFNLSDKEDQKEMDLKKANLSWDLGAGVELIKHIQVGFTYRWGLGTVAKNDLSWTTRKYDLNTNGWQITAAYLF